MSQLDTIEVTSNVLIRVEERGKLQKAHCRQGKNIWTYSGREWVTKLMSYVSGGPPTGAENNRVAMMGFGVGGDKQSFLPIGAPIDTDYPGTNAYNDSDPDIDELERPVRIASGAPTGDYWLRQLTWADTAYVVPPPTTAVRYFASFTAAEFIGSWGYAMVPLSEIGLFHYGYIGASGEYELIANVYPFPGTRPTPIAYHTFYSIPKTTDMELTVRWEVRVGG